jgi:hypothetical protein
MDLASIHKHNPAENDPPNVEIQQRFFPVLKEEKLDLLQPAVLRHYEDGKRYGADPMLPLLLTAPGRD